MATYFSPATFRFLRALARHNERAWFHAHRDDYERHVREPLAPFADYLCAALDLEF